MASSTTPMDISSLSGEQQLALQQYTSVTDQDLAAAITLLQRCQWNVQIAITRFFDGDADTVDPVAEADRVPVTNARRAETLMDSIPLRPNGTSRRAGTVPAPRVTGTPESQLTQPAPFPLNLVLMPINLTYIVFQRIFGTIGYLFPFLPRLLARFWSDRASRPSRSAGRKALSPKDTASRFKRELEEEYGPAVQTLPFFEGSYANAYDVAKRDLKYLMVVLLSPEHDDTAPFVEQTLLSPELTAWLQAPANDILLWGGTVQDAEAYQVAGALTVTRFPHICLIVHTPSVSSTAMSKVAAAHGVVSPQELINKFQTAMSAQSAELDRIRSQRAEQQASRNLRQEQESAYERSLAADREKARKRKEAEAAQADAEKAEQERIRIKEDRARNIAQWRRWRAQSLLAEPSSSDKDAVRVSIRLKNGERLMRRFPANAPLEELYAFVECYEELGDVSEKPVEAAQSYNHVYTFNLVSPLPREVYELDKGGSVRDRVGRNANLIVEPLESTDDEMDDEDDGHTE